MIESPAAKANLHTALPKMVDIPVTQNDLIHKLFKPLGTWMWLEQPCYLDILYLTCWYCLWTWYDPVDSGSGESSQRCALRSYLGSPQSNTASLITKGHVVCRMWLQNLGPKRPLDGVSLMSTGWAWIFQDQDFIQTWGCQSKSAWDEREAWTQRSLAADLRRTCPYGQ